MCAYCFSYSIPVDGTGPKREVFVRLAMVVMDMDVVRPVNKWKEVIYLADGVCMAEVKSHADSFDTFRHADQFLRLAAEELFLRRAQPGFPNQSTQAGKK